VFPASRFGEDPGLLDHLVEALERLVEALVTTDIDFWQKKSPPWQYWI
jgi:hypothetical protein